MDINGYQWKSMDIDGNRWETPARRPGNRLKPSEMVCRGAVDDFHYHLGILEDSGA